MSLKPGDKIPHFISVDENGNRFDSHEVIGKKPVVLYFYPKDFTPGCTKQACSFRDFYRFFSEKGIEIIGISPDSVSSHKRFSSKHHLPFKLLSDVQGELRELFDVKPHFFGLIPGRETLLADKDGVLRFRYRKLSSSKHLSEIEEFIRNL